jgi:glutamine synthetase
MELPPAQPVGQDPAASIHVPATLEEAVEAMQRDEALCEAMGAPFVDAFSQLKLAEWKRYVEAVDDPATTQPTDWELRYYTPFF